MGPNRAAAAESLGLCSIDFVGYHEASDAVRLDRPTLPLGERLFEILKICERGHRLDAVLGQLLTDGVEIKLALQVMHAGRQEGLSV